MALKHETRMDGVIPVGSLLEGKDVIVKTKMGRQISSGRVQSVVPFGVIIAEESGGINFFHKSLYLFVSEGAETEESDSSLDSRVREKLLTMGEAGDAVDSGSSGATKMSAAISKDDNAKDAKGDDAKDAKGDDAKDGDSKDTKGDDTKDDDKKGDDAVDPKDLPDDIKSAIASTGEMEDADVDDILSDVTDTALRSLKRSGVAEKEVLRIAQKISDAVHKILASEQPKE